MKGKDIFITKQLLEELDDNFYEINLIQEGKKYNRKEISKLNENISDTLKESIKEYNDILRDIEIEALEELRVAYEKHQMELLAEYKEQQEQLIDEAMEAYEKHQEELKREAEIKAEQLVMESIVI